jgi:hypothetical protein
VEALYRYSCDGHSYMVIFDPLTAALEYEEFELTDSKSFQ